jgi:enoyl-CoA hydratase/carnithine racemase
LIAGEGSREDCVDAVAICTPNFTHYPIAKALIDAGFDIICEKPLTATLEDAVALEKLARESGRFVDVTYIYSGYPMVHEARVRVARGEIGAVHTVLAALDEGVLTLTLNRPDVRNAMSRAMNQALARQLTVAALEPNVRCIVLTGAGKGFCAGGDVKGMAASGDGTVGAATIDEAVHRQRVNQRDTAGALFKMPKPTLAALPGPAAGAGLSLALACDLRIMASTAIMTTAFARIGFSDDYGGTYFMTQLVGTAKARDLYFLSERVSADEALRLGLVNWIQRRRAPRLLRHGRQEDQDIHGAGRPAA